MAITPKKPEAKKSSETGGKPVGDAASKKWKIHDKFNSDDADVTIVSSDGVEFKVHSYRLQAASPIFRDLLSAAKTPTQRDPIIFTDKIIEHSWVLGSLLDSVYDLEVTCLKDYDGARAVVDLAEKWDFHHVLKLMRYRFQTDGPGKDLSLRRLTLAMALKMKEPAIDSMERWASSTWGPGPDATNHSDQKAFPTVGERYLYDCSVAELMVYHTITGAKVFDLGTWEYKWYLELSPTTTWALLRARHLATTVPSVVDGDKFQAEFAKLLDIIMPDEVVKPASD